MTSLSKALFAIRENAYRADTRFYVFVAFLIVVFFTGGGSRDDIQSLLLLRPLAVLFCAYALTVRPPNQWNGRLAPLYIASALLLTMALQLVPLPASLWTQLPERQIFADIADIAGIEQPWRPLTLSPSKTLNSLFSLVVPIAAMMLYLNLDREYRKRAVLVIITLCGISALWAIFQLVGPERGPLYIYRITNFGAGVGLFANRNHQAVVLASVIVMLGWYAAPFGSSVAQKTSKFYISMAAILVLIPLIFVTGSRAGLLLMAPGLTLALFFVYLGGFHSKNSAKSDKSDSRQKIRFSGRHLFLMIGILAISGIAITSILLSRSLAFDRLFGGNELEELRLRLLPTLVAMAKDYMPSGSGFGSFEHVYKIYEPQELLRPSYLNQAHNDWLQYLIEGGIPALLIAICALFWFIRRLAILAKNWRHSDPVKYRGLMCVIVILFLLAASIGDYPLRVPSIMIIFAVLTCVFNDSIRSIQQRFIKQK